MTAKHILLAEDEAHIAKMIRFKLEKAGYEVTWKEDGEQALKAILELKPDAVILDVMMPVMSGFEVLKAVRESEGAKEIPVMMLTARGQETDKMQGFDLGANDYMTKPFSPAELAARLARLVG